MSTTGLFIRKASAGSGKTTSLVDRVLSLLEDDDEVGPIVVATYTREAAAVIHKRLTKYDSARRAGHRLMVGTLHSIAGRAMNHYRRQKGLPPLKVHADGRSSTGLVEIILQEAKRSAYLAQELKAAGVYTDVRGLAQRFVCLIDLLPAASTYTVDEVLPYFSNAELAVFAAACLTRWRHAMLDAPFSDYARILPEVTALMRAHPQNRHLLAPHHVALDEFQDLSPRQFEFIDALCRRAKSLYIVGCPDQSVYNFRAGGVIPFDQIPHRLELAAHLRDMTHELPALGQSFRCPMVVAEASRCLLSRNETGINVPMRGHTQGQIVTGWFSDESEEIDTITSSIARMRTHAFAGLGILGRTHHAVEPYFLSLVAKQVPVRIMRSDDPVSSAILDRISLWLRMALSPCDVDAAKQILSLGADNLGPATISKIEKRFVRHEAAFRTLHSTASLRGIRSPQSKAITDVANAFEQTANILKRVRSLEQWMQCMLHEIASAFRQDGIDDEDFRRAMDFAFRLGRACGTSGRFLDALAPASEAEHVSVGTFHAAKGGEWDTVFIVGASRANLEVLHRRCQDRLFAPGVLDGGIDGERRLMHVAMTRAQQTVIVTWSGGPDNASMFIRESEIPIAETPGIRVPSVRLPPIAPKRKVAGKQLLLF
jgi:DNA helicase-2/ATP-dependent DNA helicase PcrA